MASKKFTRKIDRLDRGVSLLLTQIYFIKYDRSFLRCLLNFVFLKALVVRIFVLLVTLFRFNRINFQAYKRLSFGKKIGRLLGIYKLWRMETLFKGEFKLLNHFDSDTSEVTIVIYVCGTIQNALRSLQSIDQNSMGISCHLIVVDYINLQDYLLQNKIDMPGVEFVGEHPDDISDLHNFLSRATSKFVCFITNPLFVCEDYLKNLLKVIRSKVDIGLVGAKIIYEFGLLKEAGGVITDDKQYKYFGEFSDPEKYEFSYIKETDFQSSLVLVRKADFCKALSRLRYNNWSEFSAVELSVFIKNELCKRVVFQPLALGVILDSIKSVRYHFSTKKNKRDLMTMGYSFTQKSAKSILFIDPFYPTPDKDSGSRRLDEIINIYLNLGYNVFFYGHKEYANFGEYYKNLINKNVKVIYKQFKDDLLEDEYAYLLENINFVWISRLEMNQYYASLIESFGHITWINDTVDLHFLREERMMRQQNRQSADIEHYIAKIKEKEIGLAKRADITIAITSYEKGILESEGAKKVVVVPNIHEVSKDIELLDYNTREGVCFIGGYDHIPNTDAVIWLVNEIMPLVWQTLPNLHLTLLGSNPPDSVKSLRSDLVSVPGYIKDVSPYFNKSRVFVAPLRAGAGMKGKIGQSLEYGLPVVTTSIGAEGMDLEHNEHVLIADDIISFSNEIIRLYQSENLWRKLSKNSFEVINRYSSNSVSKILESISK
ncbi:glycosyltransferase [Olivibacter domesticus]|uniref:Glycosyltransferase involved in cell wall bisynthesis n=1 Tax=Olivibacter domesticus TaxID=407022 RepID=A0A1H7YER4_OLID1|nr:glycosyltransferase [Olivibacter domesticus]SEM44716.1 Glycosyltransferase involved in cell wall bisynthesis [Olivibacter domesticus]